MATIFQSSIMPIFHVVVMPGMAVEAALAVVISWADAVYSSKTLATKTKTFVAPIVAS